jgi:DNA-directed RNA polymerase specialized sigma24 family protein
LLRRAGREAPLPDAAGSDSPDDGGAADEALLAAERRCAVRAAIDRLPPRAQAVIVTLLSEPSPSYSEVAAALGIPENSVGPIRHRALHALRSSPVLAALGLPTGGVH